jgi:hypothetical protein
MPLSAAWPVFPSSFRNPALSPLFFRDGREFFREHQERRFSMKRFNGFFPTLLVLALFMAGTLFFAGCATTGKPPANVQCAADIEWDLAPEVEVTQFECKLGEYKKKPSLLFSVGIKNVTDKPLRYRVNIFLLDLDKAAGHLVPRKGKPPVLGPGKSKVVKIPFIKTTTPSKKILVRVKPLGS